MWLHGQFLLGVSCGQMTDSASLGMELTFYFCKTRLFLSPHFGFYVVLNVAYSEYLSS